MSTSLSPTLSPVPPEVINAVSDTPVILLVDHASNHIPEELAGLGVDPACLDTHIALDLGAEALARRMAEKMGVAAVIARVSRLVLDVNRAPDHPTLIAPSSDGVDIPGNQGLTAADIKARLRAYHAPYHAACEAVLQPFIEKGQTPILLAVHSFTPEMAGAKRPWEVGFLYNKDVRLAQAMIGFLERDTDMTVGDNEPYSGFELYYTMERHGMAHGFPQTTLEVRQDELDRRAKVDGWANLLVDVLRICLQRPDVMFEQNP